MKSHLFSIGIAVSLLFVLLPSFRLTAQHVWTKENIPEQSALVSGWLKDTKVPAVGVGLIRNGEIEFVHVFGELAKEIVAPKDAIFNVASLTKPVTSVLTLRLVSSGHWDLDEPLANYWTDPDVADDLRANRLTTRHVLRHQTGFNNWRSWNESGKLEFSFEPGDSLRYSGEGFEYLRRAIESKFDRPIGELIDSLVFRPAGIEQDAYDWHYPEDSTRFAQRHAERNGTVYRHDYNQDVCSAGGLLITVEGYLRFVRSVMKAEGMSPDVYDEMIHSRVPSQPGLFMGLGWEVADDLSDGGYAMVHTGSEGGTKTLAILLPESGEALVVFTNGNNGMQLLPHIVPRTLSVGKELLMRGR